MASTPKNPSNTSADLTELKIAVGNMKYQIDAMVAQGNRQEEKLDGVKETLDALSTVSRHEFDDYRDSINARFEKLDTRYVKVESTKGIRAIGLAVGIAFATAVVLGLVRLLGAKI